jgi:branched-chain amino acid transport system substrate-binding protein
MAQQRHGRGLCRAGNGGVSAREAMMIIRGLLGAMVMAASISTAVADEKKYGPGASDTEIKLGQTMAYSGPASSLGVIGRTSVAFYKMINEQGGVNGRKIIFLSVDDGYSPPKTVEQTRRLIEQEQVLAIFGSLGTPTSASVQRYLNERKVPQLFLFSGVARFRDPQVYPWTMGGVLGFAEASRAYARYILDSASERKFAVLYQNDDYGKDHLAAFKAALGDKAASIIVKEASYEAMDPTIDSQIIELRASGADALLTVALPKFTAQAIRKVHDIGWKPLHIIAYPAASIPATLQPAGLDNSVGVISAEFVKLPGDPKWASDPEMLDYLAFMKKYAPDVNANDENAVFGYYHAASVVQLLRRCGDQLTRENVMYQATHLQTMQVPMLLPGITLNTSPTDYSPIKQMQLQRFDGTSWVPIGGISGG